MVECNVFHLQPAPFIPGQGSACQGEQKSNAAGGGADAEGRPGPPGAGVMVFQFCWR